MTRVAASSRRRRCSTSRTTTARTPTCSSGRTSSAARRSSALRVPRGDGGRRGRPPLRPRRRAADRAAVVDEETETDTWWRATFPVGNPVDALPLAALRRHVGYAWVNGLGVVGHDVPDADDFVLTTDRAGPDWHLRSVVYEIFPDRFATSGARRRGARLGGPPRLGRAADRPRARRRRSSSTAATCRDRAAPRPHRVARRERDLPDAVLPGRQHAPLRRDARSTASTRCSAATRRSPRSCAPRTRAGCASSAT